MAFPQTAAPTESEFPGSASSTDHDVAMPATVNSGDLLLALIANDGTATVTTPGGWTALDSTASTTNRLGLYAKVAAGTEGGTTVNFVTSASESMMAQVYRITSWAGTISDVEVGTAVVESSGTNDSPDPPSLTPSWGAADTLWLAVTGTDSIRTATGFPANYSNGVSTTDSDGFPSGNCTVASARRELNATSDDPGVFTLNATEQWVAQTVAVRPASAPAAAAQFMTANKGFW